MHILLYLTYLARKDEIELLGELLLLPEFADLERGEVRHAPCCCVIGRAIRAALQVYLSTGQVQLAKVETSLRYRASNPAAAVQQVRRTNSN